MHRYMDAVIHRWKCPIWWCCLNGNYGNGAFFKSLYCFNSSPHASGGIGIIPWLPYLIAVQSAEQVSYGHRASSRGREPGARPWEIHLISSSLHVINLPAQCYCNMGHSSSFRERGIDPAALSNAFMCVVSGKRKTGGKKTCRVYTINPSLSQCFFQYKQ